MRATIPPRRSRSETTLSRVEHTGFKRAVRTGITLQVDQRAQVDVVVEVGGVAESVTVEAEAPLVDTGSASIGKVVENRRVVELPLNGRNALALTLLTPSVKSNAGSTNSGFGDRGIQLSSISINGGPNAMNGQLLDGGNNIQSYIGEVAINPGVDSVEEFKVQSGAMSAEYGFTGGGVINMVTKSGTNSYPRHVYTSSSATTNSMRGIRSPFPSRHFDTTSTALRPVDRSSKIARSSSGTGSSTTIVAPKPRIGTFPTALQRTGDFSDLLDSSGRLIPIYDPATTRCKPERNRLHSGCLSGQQDPANRLDPVALKIQENFLPAAEPYSYGPVHERQ